MRALSSFLLIYYNQALHLSPTSVSLMISLIVIFDAVCDPLVGYVSDNFRSRWGRRHPFMYFSAAPLAISFFLLWNPPAGWNEAALLGWLFTCLLVIRVTDTLFELPSQALGPELVQDYDGRTRIVNFRIVFRTLASLLVTVLGLQIFMRSGPDGSGGVTDSAGYFGFSLALSVIMFCVILISAFSTHRYIPFLQKPRHREVGSVRAFRQDAKSILTNRAALVMLGVGMFQSVAGGTRNGLDLYFGIYFWELNQAQLSLMATMSAVGALIGACAVGFTSHLFSKRSGTIIFYSLGLLNSTVPIGLRLLDLMPANGSQALAIILTAESLLQGMLYVMSAVLMNSMLADVVEDVAVRSGRRSEGLLFSADQFFTKAVSGVGVMISGGMLAIVAFPRDAKPGRVDASAIENLGLLYLPVVVGMTLFAVLLLLFYKIDRSMHERNVADVRRMMEFEDRGATHTPPIG